MGYDNVRIVSEGRARRLNQLGRTGKHSLSALGTIRLKIALRVHAGSGKVVCCSRGRQPGFIHSYRAHTCISGHSNNPYTSGEWKRTLCCILEQQLSCRFHICHIRGAIQFVLVKSLRIERLLAVRT